MSGSRGTRAEAGETLVEVLVAIAILGIAAVAVVAGLGLAVKSSDIQRKQATGSASVRSLAEAIQNFVAAQPTNYQKCAGPNYYTSKMAGILPTGYIATQTAAQVWSGSGWTTCGTDTGVQQITLNVQSPGDASHTATETLSFVLRAPCTGAFPTPC